MKKTSLIFALLIIVSCTSNTILEKPKDLIPKDTMVLVLKDLFIARGARIEKNTQNIRKVNYVPLVYNRYRIDSVRFMSSNYYYTSRIEEYELIYNEVSKILSSEKKTLEEQINKTSKKGGKSVIVDGTTFDENK